MFNRKLALGKIIAPLHAIEQELNEFVSQASDEINSNDTKIHDLQEQNKELDAERQHAAAVRKNVLNILNVA